MTAPSKNSPVIASTDRTPAVVAAVSLSLILLITLSLGATVRKSPTSDEVIHLFAGYTYIKWADYRINPEHPPFAKFLAALPLLSLKVNDAFLSREQRDLIQTRGVDGWRLANLWLFFNNDAEKLLFYAKLPMLGISLLLGLLVFSWARELFGLNAALAALGIYVLDPNILAHSTIIHTDIPFTLAFFGGTYFLWRTFKEITWSNWLATAVFFSMAAVTKFSFVTILPIWSLLGALHIFSPSTIRLRIGPVSEISGRWPKTGWLVTILLSIVGVAYCTIWLIYGFKYDAVAGQHESLGISSAVSPSSWLIPWIKINSVFHLLPEAWSSGMVYALSTFNRTAYLLGEISGEGFWLYFPIAFAVKTPTPTLLLLLVSLICLLDKQKFTADDKFVIVPVLVFTSLAVLSHMNIGLRHILPIYPFLFVWLGGTVGMLWSNKSIAMRSSVLVLAVWLIWSSLKTYPDYLAFFNETIGSQSRHRILVDSNLDWGQDLKGLKSWMDAHDVEKIRLAYFGTADPTYYGIDAIHQPGTWSTVLAAPRNNGNLTTAPYIAISATHLAGLYFWPSNPYERYLKSNPVAIIGGSIYIYSTIE